MKVGDIKQQRVVKIPEWYSEEEVDAIIENTLNNKREFKVGYVWEDENQIRIYFAPHEQYAEELNDEFVDEQIEYLESLLSM